MNSDLYNNLQNKIRAVLKNFSFADEEIHPKKAIIWDKTCPKCKNFLYGNNAFCACGYSTIREKTVKIWGIVAFTWLFIFGLILFVFNSFSEINSIIYKKLEKSGGNSSYSLSPANIQIITDLKNTKYRDYIQTIYVHPTQKNKLMVLIKPVYWDMLPKQEKEALKQTIMKKWSEIYINTNPDSDLKPEVHLANFE